MRTNNLHNLANMLWGGGGGGLGPTLSALHEVRGTADADGGAYSPFRSILLVLTHDFIIIQLYGPAGGDGQDGLNDADAGYILRTILDAV